MTSNETPPAASEAAPYQTPRGFWNLMFTQFQGAFSDNALKWLVVFLVFKMGFSDEKQDSMVTLAGGVFAVPFLLFSMWGGWLSDRYSKRTVMIGVKTAEIAIMLFAALGLWMESLPLQMIAICCMGLHSAVFAPAKYGILPEILPASRLSWGNGILELLTFVAIIAGTVAGGWLADALHGRQAWSGILLAALAFAGFLTSIGSPRVQAADPAKPFVWNFPAEIWRQLKKMHPDRDLWRANWGNAGFFYIAALVQLNLALFAKQDFGLKATEQSWLQAALCLGIGGGSAFTGHFSRGRIAYGFIPIGAGLMTAAALLMGWPKISQGVFTGALAALGIGSGMFIVPVASVLQHRPAASEKGAVQGVASWVSWIGILAASLTLELLGKVFGLNHAQVFWFCGVCALVAGLYVARSRPGAIKALFSKGGSVNPH
jgi:acyl-[acyl-carrier-protein]-phospholipid O-acyltransferase/long-chain-fatty-acid--[acyl-carrier-protein] ligase